MTQTQIETLWTEARESHSTVYGARMYMRNVHGLKWSHRKWRHTTKDQNRNKR